MLVGRSFILTIATLLVGCSSTDDFGTRVAGSPAEHERSGMPLLAKGFVDARTYVASRSETESESWYALTFQLRDDFDAVCGDTFCEGDYTNYQSLGFRCSVEQRSGIVGRCVWVLAASLDEVTPSTGAIVVQARTWTCPMPIRSGTRFAELLSALSTSGPPIHAILPRSDRSLYDGLAECL